MILHQVPLQLHWCLFSRNLGDLSLQRKGNVKKSANVKKIFADGGGEVANAQRQSAMKDMTALLCDDISRITLSCNCDLNYIQDLLCNDTITIQL